MNRCKDCEYYCLKYRSCDCEKYKLGYRGKFKHEIEEDDHPDDYDFVDEDEIKVEDDGAFGFSPGPLFGCIHWEKKEAK